METKIESSFFGIFKTQASPTQKKLIIFICILFGTTACPILGIPIFFKDPKLLCKSNDLNYFECNEDYICSNPGVIWETDMKEGPKSLSAEYGLICEKQSLKRMAITLNFAGIFIGCFLSTFILIDESKRKNFLGFFGNLMGISLILMLFTTNFNFIALLIGLASFCFIYINTYSYLFIGENFTGELAGFVTIMYSVTWATTGIFFSIFAFLINANWKIFVILSGILSIIAGIVLFILPNQKREIKSPQGEEEIEVQAPGLISYLSDMWPNKIIRTNFLVYALFWSIFTVCYCVILVELESVGGNLYFNMCLCSIIEILAALVASAITKYYNCSKAIGWLLTFLSIFFTIFIFAPTSLSGLPLSKTFIFIIFMLITKLNNDTLNLVTYLYLPKAFTDKYVALWMIVSRFLSRFLGLFVPTMNYFSRSIEFHPFVFYGLVYCVCRVLFMFTKEVQSEGVDDLLNNAKVSLFQRLSVISASHPGGNLTLHDNTLKNIKVNGIHLSLIRKNIREKSWIGFKSMFNQDTNLSTELLGKNEKEKRLYELSEKIKIEK